MRGTRCRPATTPRNAGPEIAQSARDSMHLAQLTRRHPAAAVCREARRALQVARQRDYTDLTRSACRFGQEIGEHGMQLQQSVRRAAQVRQR